MNATAPVAWGDIATWIQSLVVVAAAVTALVQLRRADDSRRVDRVLEIHREMTTAEVGQARERLGAVIRTNKGCVQPSLSELRGLRTVDDNPEDALVVVLRAFERAWESYNANRLDRPMAQRLLGSTVAWWDLALRGIEPSELHSVEALRLLAIALDPDGSHHRRHTSADFRSP